ncbi:MAG: hypothetical protein IJY62_00745 [Clostridia bacterium]|nr:hypothetical protein [Clostridia bacterium]
MKKLLTGVLSAVLLISCAGCGDSKGGDSIGEYFVLDAFTENSADGAYDSEYFYRNDFRQFASDTSSIYVPEGRHTDENGVDLYGGYYYLFPSGTNMGANGMFTQNYGEYSAANPVLRSRDLVEWELCGALNGAFSTKIVPEDWISGFTWAPAPIYDEEKGLYVNYYAATSKINDGTDPNAEYPGNTGNAYDRFFIAIAVSKTPVGPYVTVTSENYYGDKDQPNLNGKVITKENPPINFRYDLGLDEYFGVIDPQPFLAENGELYLYFSRHVGSDYQGVNIWGMKMKDFITPDYSTITYLIKADYTTVTKNERWETSNKAKCELESYDIGERCPDSEIGEVFYHGGGNEGAFGYEYEGRNFLIYNGGGYENHYYDACQTISDTGPLGPFTKLPQWPGSVVGTTVWNDWATGSGHGSLIHSADSSQLFWIGNCMGNKNVTAGAQKTGRYYYLTEVFVVETEEYGNILYGNGPTNSLQPRIKDVSGRTNIAPEAKVSVTNAKDEKSAKYINDGLFVSNDYYKDWEFSAKGATEITLTFDEPRTIGAVMVYNSYAYEYAFSAVDYIEFELAEKPSWYTAASYVSKARVSNIKFSEDFIGESNTMKTGGSCLASFNEIKVKSVTVSISKRLNQTGKEIRVSDIVILGN